MDQINLIDGVYKSLLRTVGLEVTPDYFVRMNLGDKQYVPATKGGRQLVLPVTSQLRSPEIGNRLVFHPLRDNSLTKDSELLTFYRHLLINRVNVVIAALGYDLLRLAASPKMHKDMSPDQQAFLRLVPDADQRSIDDFEAIGAAASKTNQLQRAFVTIYLRKGIPLKGQAFQRIASINFPFYKELMDWEEDEKNRKATKAKKTTKGDHEIYDIGVRVKDRETFKGLMQYLIPNVQEDHFYDTGSNSQIAPGMDAMMRSFIPLAGHLNAIIELFTGLIPDVEEMTFDSEWAEAFNNLDVLWTQIRDIPEQSMAVTETAPAPAPARAPAPVAAAALPWDTPYQQAQPVYAPQATATAQPQQRPQSSSGGGVPFSELMRNQQSQQPAYPQGPGGYPPGGGFSPYGQQQPGYPQGMGGYPNQGPQYQPNFGPAGGRNRY